MTPAQYIAVSNYLSDYDPALTYTGILTAIEVGDDEAVTLWEPFEGHRPSDVCAYIEALRGQIEDALKGGAQ